MANWNAEAVAVSPLLLGNISIHPVPTQFSLGMDKRFLRIKIAANVYISQVHKKTKVQAKYPKVHDHGWLHYSTT